MSDFSFGAHWKQHRDDIEADFPVVAVHFHIPGSGFRQKALFFDRNKLLRPAKMLGTTSFDLNQYQHSAIHSYYVHFSASVSPVAVQYYEALLFKKLCGKDFTCLAGIIVLCHGF